MSKGTDAMHAGSLMGRNLVPYIKAAEDTMDDDEILAWWAGLFSGLAGIACASIGPQAVAAIGEITRGAIEPVLKEMQN